MADANNRRSVRRPSIDDVAKLAGVSRQTVSNVLNGRKSYFSTQTQARVMAAMETLSYKPNRAAQTLRSRRSMQIGYHMSGEELEIVKGFTLSFLQALIKAAARQGYQILVFTHSDSNPLAVFNELIARGNVDALIISESQVDDPRVRLLAHGKLPFVSFGRLAPDLPQQWVDIDNSDGMAMLMDYLVAKGYGRFAYIGAEGDEYWKVERLHGFRRALEHHGLNAADGDVFQGSGEAIREQVRRVLGRRQRPDAIVTGSDYIAAVVVNVCHSLGLRVGRDIAVTGFDGGAMGLITEPTITSVRIPLEKVASELIARCQAEIDAGPTGRPGVVIPTEIFQGGSA
ncbi:DNA-binding LacI/PurR family transcriptional regulator [Thermocatellispora tengchongensis]|uniref:DNA-binding LacI/PurR family transcriptional regulator n=1 Tax=Thermocatellispora tengchongensis TaxID=1073253 RepID=A0A840PHX5_9ACTN|nr:LacI family DNA-binding transcriptional regulator [Thermocatellispora tengchongensis]MBB5137503.1 DNA-binding LacI/PurR family transcriptional regulator [Thermocatellispora tengchongensis]